MQVLRPQILLALFILLFAGAASAALSDALPVPAPPKLGAESYILLDYHSGRVIAERAPDERRDPASLTKLMTAYVVFAELKAGKLAMDEMVPISEKAWRAPGSRMFIEVGTEVSVRDLTKGMIIQSGNDASIALAEKIAGTEAIFAQLMNRYAQKLGMTNTHYTNATGLPNPEHYTTARDTAILARALIRDFPKYYKFYSQKSFTWNGIEQYNRNKLLWRDPTVDGLKTGHTKSAGYCLTSSAEREGMRLVAVVMDTDSAEARVEQSAALLNYGFRFYETHRLYQAGEALASARIWKGTADATPLGIIHDLYVTIPQRRYDSLQASMSVDKQVVAPVAKGQQFGSVTVKLQDRTLAEVPLVALEEVPQGNLWQRLTDEVVMMFQ